ncbi:MAG TPA: hypothetical protein VI704_05690, partial [Bacteroidota bacterium]|nr:hypothetical protein [Bacteroidota bacterium]
ELKYLRMAAAPSDWRYPVFLKDQPALLLHFSALDLDQKTLLQRFADLAEDLKNSGAKVVFIPLKEGLFWSPENMKSLERMKQTGIVILGYSPPRNEIPFSEGGRNSWWSDQPIAGYRTKDSLAKVWGPLTIGISEFQDYYSFIPYGVRHFYEGQMMHDATIQAILRLLGSAESGVQLGADEFRIGTHKIPLWGDGIAFVKGWKAFSEPSKVVITESNMMTTTLTYDGTKEKTPLEIYRGRIVVVDWWDMTNYQWPSLGRKAWYIINSIMNDNFLKRTDDWEILLITLFIFTSAALLFFFPSGRTVFGLLLFGIGFLFFCRWLFAFQNVILDPLYPLFSLTLCMLILPVIKLADEKRVLTVERTSLLAEKKRLEEEAQENQSERT